MDWQRTSHATLDRHKICAFRTTLHTQQATPRSHIVIRRARTLTNSEIKASTPTCSQVLQRRMHAPRSSHIYFMHISFLLTLGPLSPAARAPLHSLPPASPLESSSSSEQNALCCRPRCRSSCRACFRLLLPRTIFGLQSVAIPQHLLCRQPFCPHTSSSSVAARSNGAARRTCQPGWGA